MSSEPSWDGAHHQLQADRPKVKVGLQLSTPCVSAVSVGTLAVILLCIYVLDDAGDAAVNSSLVPSPWPKCDPATFNNDAAHNFAADCTRCSAPTEARTRGNVVPSGWRGVDGPCNETLGVVGQQQRCQITSRAKGAPATRATHGVLSAGMYSGHAAQV
jgi:hypothetical protein